MLINAHIGSVDDSENVSAQGLRHWGRIFLSLTFLSGLVLLDLMTWIVTQRYRSVLFKQYGVKQPSNTKSESLPDWSIDLI